ncbi:MAG TPA: hypothetical protein DCM86_14200 [Verrucomicrobiales bacterium]|nr:hypothetical protein [Verrucomicrobiales bacterium]
MKTMLRSLLLALVVASGLTSSSQAQSASTPQSTLLMSIKGGSIQGDLTGEVTQKGREGQHMLQACTHEISVVRDPASGLPTGKRQHQPFRVVKLLNKSSPLLLQSMVVGETIAAVTIDVWNVAPTGIETKLMSYVLRGAQVASVRPWTPNKQDSSASGYAPAEEVAFTYKTITITYWNGGIESTDSWQQ